MDHLERFEDLISAMRVKGVSEDYLLCKLFRFSLAGEASIGSNSYNQDLLCPGAKSRMNSYAIYLMRRVLKTGSAGGAFTGIIHFCGLFPAELRRNCERPRGADWQCPSFS